MDPLSQGVVGAALPQSAADKEQLKIAGVLGFLAGMAADLDVLIRSEQDPLLFLEFHRQFTHSLIFIPVGGIICAIVLHKLVGKRFNLHFRQSWLYCTLGYATHALLDSCTTYGTQLLWPFSDVRIAWNNISIIDPIYTVPILALVTLAAIKKSSLAARLAFAWVLIYPTIGLIQRDRAIDAGLLLAEERQHSPSRLEAKPSFGNILVWKIVYETQQHFYVDAVRVGMETRVYPGSRVEKLDVDRDFPWLKKDTQQARDIERFRWFSNGYIAKDPNDATRIIDVRYSMIPNDIAALWGIIVSPSAAHNEHVRYQTNRDMSPNKTTIFSNMVFDR